MWKPLTDRLILGIRLPYYTYRTAHLILPKRYIHNVNKYTNRTHCCGQLSVGDVGKRVNLFGWIQYTRFDNKIIALRDSYGVTQCVIRQSDLRKKLKLNNESVISVRGTVRERPSDQVNLSLSTGEVEVQVEDIEVLSNADKNLPFLARGDCANISATNKLKYRHLFLRTAGAQKTLRFRSNLCRALREVLIDLDFVECETPTLFNRTPGGANEFIVPTQTPGKFYSLPQSPQQLKQLLMIAGLDRYFQICRCYRDETGRSDRQPEFTQLDIELSFTSKDLIMDLVEDVLCKALVQVFGKDNPVFSGGGRFGRITYQESFEKYGTDKPDTRFDWVIQQKDDGLYIDVPYLLSDEELYLRILSDLNFTTSQSEQVKFHRFPEPRIRFYTDDNSESSRKLLGVLRPTVAKYLENRGEKVYEERFKFLWVVDFPLFTKDEEGNIEPNHHPFTAPTEATAHMLTDKPSEVIGQHYDLVLNGQEIGGGSVRIHDPKLQKQIFEDLLRVEEKAFSYFIEALKSGCPPHGGIALGLDRLVAILLGHESIREVIAFPKSTTGRDLLTDCPQELDESVKKLYHLGHSIDNNNDNNIVKGR